jgi:hypothetical protein
MRGTCLSPAQTYSSSSSQTSSCLYRRQRHAARLLQQQFPGRHHARSITVRPAASQLDESTQGDMTGLPQPVASKPASMVDDLPAKEAAKFTTDSWQWRGYNISYVVISRSNSPSAHPELIKEGCCIQRCTWVCLRLSICASHKQHVGPVLASRSDAAADAMSRPFEAAWSNISAAVPSV